MEINGKPLTTTDTREVSPSLLRNEIDSRIVKVRPMSTPIDQISRLAGSRYCGSMIVDYYSVASKRTYSLLDKGITAASTPASEATGYVADLSVKEPEIFQPSETVLFPDACYAKGGEVGHVTGYVLSVDKSKKTVRVCLFNFSHDAAGGLNVTSIPAGSAMVRMGRAAAELDVQTPQFEALPVKASNFCQIFKMQVEQSTFQRIANKEVGWTFSDQEEIAIADMRLGMEKNFLFGKKLRMSNPDTGEEVFLTGGIWNQAGKEYTIEQDDVLDEAKLVSICQSVFTNNSGNHRKILLAGSGLMAKISKITVGKVLLGNQTFVKWGLEFREIVTNFGRLYVIHSEILDSCGHASDGLIIDPEYLTKYSHVPFRTDRLDLRSAGIRNTDAIVVTECSCMVLRNPDAHCRLIDYSA